MKKLFIFISLILTMIVLVGCSDATRREPIDIPPVEDPDTPIVVDPTIELNERIEELEQQILDLLTTTEEQKTRLESFLKGYANDSGRDAGYIANYFVSRVMQTLSHDDTIAMYKWLKDNNVPSAKDNYVFHNQKIIDWYFEFGPGKEIWG